ncbi:hypothetical protein [uncultured Sulfitobacter sp.]|uniref:hypothetical protein n=1 Tax=uncultured Sulfitobacter sp. TaxID=191468 RepID=UPI0025969ADD|nr:hypothetical protein [uncultured Sulfitobacter sp.]
MINIDAFPLLEVEDFLAQVPEVSRQSMSLAMNDTLSGPGLTVYRQSMLAQVDFGHGYLDDDRLGMTKRATPQRLEAVITGRHRPTSLARFARSQATGQKGGVRVQVKPGRSRTIKRGFLVRLRAGKVLDDSNFNVGLALRLKPGERIVNKNTAAKTAQLAPNVYLLYGPSVDQVLTSVAESDTPQVLDKLEAEFLRQFVRLSDAA